jgi:hypothetical protein
MSIKTKLERYNVAKQKLALAEQVLLSDLRKQLDKHELKFNNIGERSIENLEINEDGNVVFNYRIVNYDESDPAQLVLK